MLSPHYVRLQGAFLRCILLTPAEKDKLSVIIPKDYRKALGIFVEKLLKLGIHNTLEELLQGQQVGQRERLLLTGTGRMLLQRLGYPIPSLHQASSRIATALKRNICVAPITRLVHPNLNKNRRRLRVEALQRLFRNDTYVDAAKHPTRTAHAVVVVHSGGHTMP